MKLFSARLVASLISIGVLTAGCGSSTDTSDGPAASSTVNISQANAVSDFPVGATRVVASGYGIDNLLALGIKPVAVVEGLVPMPAPWHGNKLDGVPVIKTQGKDARTVSAEQVATYKPDLFVGDSYAVNKAVYDRLSKISPVLGAIGEDAQGGWDAQLSVLGKILGKEKQAQEVLNADRTRVAEMKTRHPGLAGKTAVVAQYIAASSAFNLVAAPEDPANQLFAELGMTVPSAVLNSAEFSKSKEATGGRTPVSLERLPLIAANFMAIYPAGAAPEALDALPGYSSLPQVSAGTTMVSDITTIVGMNQPTVLSREWILSKLEPYFAKVDQQPAVA